MSKQSGRLFTLALVAAACCLGTGSLDPALAQASEETGVLRPITRAYPEQLRDPFTVPSPAPRQKLQPQPVQPVEPVEEALEPTEISRAEEPAGPEFVLSGIVQSRMGATALIVDRGETIIARAGQRIGGYRVVRVELRGVELDGVGGHYRLEPGARPKPVSARL
ncbi:MAG: hypothetical protein HY319_28975 [Armatimonadetes bacterium]|nr:hypothetical protein [Armatimonadota bacterium]